MFIEAHKKSYEVQTLCRVLGVSRSGYYDWKSRGISNQFSKEIKLVREIRLVHEAHRQRYGYRKTWKKLILQGVPCGKEQVGRIRKKYGIEAKRVKRFKMTTKSKHKKWVAENILNQQFVAETINQILVGDVTFIQTREGWLYLAVLLDLYSRKTIGWSMSENNDKWLVLSALEMAKTRRGSLEGALHHTDRGSVYCSDEYQEKLKKYGMRVSMSRKGNCYDNAVSESFFSTIKNELIYGETFRTRSEARRAIFEYIEMYYNRQRLHQALGYQTPDQMELLPN